MAVHEGGCLCGGIRYAVKSPPTRVTVCHCRFCQRATGSAYMVEPVFGKTDFVVTGKPKIYRLQSAGSGKTVEVHFCDACGTKLFLSFERFRDVVGVYAGTFDDPNWFELSAANTKHIFLNVAQHGTAIPAGFACFEEHAITNDGQPLAPSVSASTRVIS